MAKYKVIVTEEIRTTYVIEARSASTAIDVVRSQKNAPNVHRSLEQHFRTEIIEEEN